MASRSKIYLQKTVDVALSERLDWIFSTFDDICISISSGKDSTVLWDATQKEAKRRGRKIHVFFLDQEAEYRATVELVRRQMGAGDHIIPHWFQAPIRMTNATSQTQEMLYAWGPGELWMRPKEPGSIHKAPGAPERFYPFFQWWEKQWGPGTAMLVGLRAEEGPNRFRATTRNPGIPGVPWTTGGHGGCMRCYPIYDWTFEDVWTWIGKYKVPYNRIYDFQWAKSRGARSIPSMRVSNLIHEKSFHCLTDLQEFEPETYEALVKRLDGVHTAALYADEPTMYNAIKLPEAYAAWRDYRDFLLLTSAISDENKQILRDRFDGQPDVPDAHRQQARQILLNDWENNIPVKVAPKIDIRAKWKELL